MTISLSLVLTSQRVLLKKSKKQNEESTADKLMRKQEFIEHFIKGK